MPQKGSVAANTKPGPVYQFGELHHSWTMVSKLAHVQALVVLARRRFD
jgi:hypothetical protein